MHVFFKAFCWRYVQIDFILLWYLPVIRYSFFSSMLSEYLILFLMNLPVGLSYATDETTLKNAFSAYGNVLEGYLSNLF
jgi:hypothetical protein